MVLKQSGWCPVSFRVRFTVDGALSGSVIVDGVTDRELARCGAPLGNPFEGGPGNATDPWWTARDPFAGSQT